MLNDEKVVAKKMGIQVQRKIMRSKSLKESFSKVQGSHVMRSMILIRGKVTVHVR